LDVGTGSGFLAACLGKLAAEVRSVEIFADLAHSAATNLYASASNNVVVQTMDVWQLAEQERYDAIAVTGSLPVYDERFARALKIGGRLFVVVGQAPVMQALKIVRTGASIWRREPLFETVVEPLVNAGSVSTFKF
jgi:protein-L-isoaspartate(D-aspartate) O-methyltransferase